MSEPRHQHQREPLPWRNLAPQAPLPEPHRDRWQWRAGEIALGPTPQRPATPLMAESVRRADNV
jgi:hypothetical protein